MRAMELGMTSSNSSTKQHKLETKIKMPRERGANIETCRHATTARTTENEGQGADKRGEVDEVSSCNKAIELWEHEEDRRGGDVAGEVGRDGCGVWREEEGMGAGR